jgi:phage terminase Nu1 subunit (DNA packaging protein)
MTYPVFDDDDLADLLGTEESSAEPQPMVPAMPLPESLDSPAQTCGESIAAVMNESDLARLFGITANRVRTLARDGIVVRHSRGQFAVAESISRYLARLQESASRAGRPTLVENDRLKAEKLRLAKEQADALEIKNSASRGELVRTSEVEREWSNVLRDVRAALLAVPSRCGARLPTLTPHDIAEIDREIRATLEGLADGN